MKRILISLIAVMSFWVTPSPAAYADDVYAREDVDNKIVTEQVADGRYRTRVPLAAIRSEQGGIRLQGADAGEEVSLAIAPQADIDTARFLLRHATSRAQQDTRPHLRVEINQQFAAQLDGATGYSAALDEVTLDGRTFKPGFNQIRLDALQRYTFDCQDPTASELWTEIDTQRSFVELNYSRRPFTGSLADMNMFMSPGVGGVEQLVIATAREGTTATDQHLRWGALASQAIANRMGYGLPRIFHSQVARTAERVSDTSPAPHLDLNPALASGADIVLIGTFAEIGDVIDIDHKDIKAGEGLVVLGPSPADPTHFILVLAGEDAAGVERAVLSVGLATFPFADTQRAVITAEDAPEGMSLSTRAPVKPGHSYSFGDLGMSTRSMIGSDHASANLMFELPSDFFAREKDEVVLSLDFGYGAALEPDSVLNILVNGIFRQGLPLANPLGEAAAGYEIRLPARVFSPGKNVVRFDAELSKQQSGACTTRNDRNLAFVLESSSMIRVPDAPSYVELPNLALMAATGYPFSAATNQNFSIRSATASSSSLAATWTMAARLGQMHGALFRNVDFTISDQPADQNTLMVGARSSLQGLLAGPMGLSPDTVSDNALGAAPVRRLRVGELGHSGLVLSGENPAKKETLLTVVSAQTDAMLLSSVQTLIQPSHWSQIKGAATMWRAKSSTVSTQSATEVFHSGSIRAADRVAYENARSPGRWVFLIGALLFGIAVVLAMVARYMRKRTQGSK